MGQTRKIVVVGSGLSGLLTAALLERERARGAGIEVAVCERASTSGGRARSPLLAGVPVNLGPRALYRGGPLARALSSLGIKPSGFVPPAAGTLASVDGALAPLPTNVVELMRDRRLDLGDKRALAAALARIAVGALDVRDGDDVDAWLARHAGTPKVSALLRMLIRVATYSDDGAHDASLALTQLRRALGKGVLYVDGGWASIIAALERIAPPSRRARVEALDDIDADDVVIATSFEESRALLATTERPHFDSTRGAHGAQGAHGAPVAVTVAVSCLDLVLARLPKPERRIAFGVDVPSYFSVHSRPNLADIAPGSPVVAHAMWSTPKSSAPNASDATVDRATLERWVDEVQPGWRDVVVEARYLSRMVVSTLPTPNRARPSIVVRDGTGGGSVPGRRVFVVGDYVDSGALLADGAAASAVSVVHAIASMSMTTATRATSTNRTSRAERAA